MPQEIERKFLVLNDDYKKNTAGIPYCQGYLNSNENRTVRIRIADGKAALTVKGLSTGAVRPEFEYSIPLEDAKIMLTFCEKPLIEKLRYKVAFQGMIWEIDEFAGDNEGLVIAEIELESEDQPFPKPGWIGAEVTADPKYYNSNLIHHPYKHW